MLRSVFVLVTVLFGASVFAQSPSECRLFRTSVVTDSAATLSWNAPATGDPSTGYLVHCKESDVQGWTRLSGRFQFEHSVEYDSLTAGTAYDCRCRAWSAGEEKAKSPPVYLQFTTALPDVERSGIPGDPISFAQTWASDTEIRFDWLPPVQGGVATGYTVSFRTGPAQGQWGAWTVVTSAAAPQSETYVELSGLTAASFVQLKVKAANAEGVQDSGDGAWLIGQTKANAPTPGPTPEPTPQPTPVPPVPAELSFVAEYGSSVLHSTPAYFPQANEILWVVSTNNRGVFIGEYGVDLPGATQDLFTDRYFQKLVQLSSPQVVVYVNANGGTRPNPAQIELVDYIDSVDGASISNPRSLTFSDGLSDDFWGMGALGEDLYIRTVASPNALRHYTISGSEAVYVDTITLSGGPTIGTGDNNAAYNNFAVTPSKFVFMGTELSGCGAMIFEVFNRDGSYSSHKDWSDRGNFSDNIAWIDDKLWAGGNCQSGNQLGYTPTWVIGSQPADRCLVGTVGEFR